MADGRVIVKEYQRYKDERAPFDSRWERMAPFIAPSRVGIISEISGNDSLMRGVYDSTSMMAAELMAHFVAGHIFNPGTRWFSFELPGTGDTTQEWLEECLDISNRNILASPFYAEAPESLIDWGGFGTGFLLGEESAQPVNRTIKGFRGFNWRAEKTGRFVIADGPDGKPDTAYREFRITAEAMKRQWPDGSFPENVNKAIEENQGLKKFTMLHCIKPRPRVERSGAGNKGMAWGSYWIELESKHIIWESGYRRLPGAIFRYQKVGDEAYGRGRGDIAFPDTWSLNTAKRMGFEDWALKIKPPIFHSHNSVIGGTLRLVPGGPTPINTHGRDIRQSIMPFETGGRPEVSQIKEEELRMSIRQIFYIDHILKLLETEKSEMTKYEFAKKVALLFKLIGPVYGRAQHELLYNVVDLIWDLQYHAGAFPDPPDEVQDTDGNINVVFHNPIAKAQKGDDAEALMIAVNDIAPLINVDPSVMDRVDMDKAFDEILDIRGVPARWQRTDEEVQALRDAKHQQNQQQLQADQMEQMAGAAGKMAPIAKIVGAQ